MISLRDQEVFKVFRNAKLEKEKDGLEHSNQVDFHFSPVDGVEVDDFDFDISIAKDNFGAKSDKVKCDGVATLADGTEAKFTIPISLIKLSFELDKKYNHEFKFDAN